MRAFAYTPSVQSEISIFLAFSCRRPEIRAAPLCVPLCPVSTRVTSFFPSRCSRSPQASGCYARPCSTPSSFVTRSPRLRSKLHSLEGGGLINRRHEASRLFAGVKICRAKEGGKNRGKSRSMKVVGGRASDVKLFDVLFPSFLSFFLSSISMKSSRFDSSLLVRRSFSIFLLWFLSSWKIFRRRNYYKFDRYLNFHDGSMELIRLRI